MSTTFKIYLESVFQQQLLYFIMYQADCQSLHESFFKYYFIFFKDLIYTINDFITCQ